MITIRLFQWLNLGPTCFLADCEAQNGAGKWIEGEASQLETSCRRSYFSPSVAAFLWGLSDPRPVPAFF